MKKVFAAALCIILLLPCLCHCSPRLKSNTFFAMNTFITVNAESSKTARDIELCTQEYEGLFSRTLPQSEIYRLNSDGELYPDSEVYGLLTKAVEISKATDNAYNPCMGSIASLWDITSGKSLVPSDESIAKALESADISKLIFDGEGKVLLQDGCKVDLGGIAKGYALGKAYEKAIENGEENFSVSFGGNVGVHGCSDSSIKNGKKGWSVGITNPFDKEQALGTLLMQDSFISVSGAYERFFEKDGKIYHHIFDSHTGYPAISDIACACVISTDAALGDALSTALFVMGSGKAQEFWSQGEYGFEMILILNDKTVLISDGISSDFSLTDTQNFKVKILQAKTN